MLSARVALADNVAGGVENAPGAQSCLQKLQKEVAWTLNGMLLKCTHICKKNKVASGKCPALSSAARYI